MHLAAAGDKDTRETCAGIPASVTSHALRGRKIPRGQSGAPGGHRQLDLSQWRIEPGGNLLKRSTSRPSLARQLEKTCGDVWEESLGFCPADLPTETSWQPISSHCLCRGWKNKRAATEGRHYSKLFWNTTEEVQV